MTPVLLLFWVLGLAAVPISLLTCKKKAKAGGKPESTTTEGGTKKSNPKQSPEVQEWNAKINAGMKRPQRDDETVDDQPTDWGQVQKVDVKEEPNSLKPDSQKIDSQTAPPKADPKKVEA
ncbi:hypothetical protein PRIPAC_75004 [Pristionchus pacificus]|uniref:Uncharacterized protein n=1 Tax=Pristionchus pacificus TaxID=54126 RepID=A0A2A6C666_PRIPA|nr:hypothetical protein PRIPAC_75004 [Pristionchus pacificus]|eukprot:PDM73578.1 hypothetical protein PRIPAC_40934 [Pristionchus pacificus]